MSYLIKKRNPDNPPPKRGIIHHILEGEGALCMAGHKMNRGAWVVVESIGANGHLCAGCATRETT